MFFSEFSPCPTGRLSFVSTLCALFPWFSLRRRILPSLGMYLTILELQPRLSPSSNSLFRNLFLPWPTILGQASHVLTQTAGKPGFGHRFGRKTVSRKCRGLAKDPPTSSSYSSRSTRTKYCRKVRADAHPRYRPSPHVRSGAGERRRFFVTTRSGSHGSRLPAAGLWRLSASHHFRIPRIPCGCQRSGGSFGAAASTNFSRW